MSGTKTPSRRKFLQGAAIVSIVVAGGVVYRGVDRGAFTNSQGPAYEPWKEWRSAQQGTPLALVQSAILAANPHNTQPWMFLVGEDSIEVYADEQRNLGSFDPYLREMHLGLGCAIENMLVAAPSHGFGVALSVDRGILEPLKGPGELRRVASLDLVPNPPRLTDLYARDLYSVIPKRHTNRGSYRARDIDPAALERLLLAMDNFGEVRLDIWKRGEEQREVFDRLTLEATEQIIADKEMAHDSDAWFRFTPEKVQQFRDGPTLEAAGMNPALLAIAKMLPPVSAEQSHAVWLANTRDRVPASPIVGTLSVRDLYDCQQTIEAGRAWQHMHLLATTLGIAMQPINQAIEVVDREGRVGNEPHMTGKLAQLLATDQWRPTFAFRMGYPVFAALPSPRRALDDVFRETRLET